MRLPTILHDYLGCDSMRSLLGCAFQHTKWCLIHSSYLKVWKTPIAIQKYSPNHVHIAAQFKPLLSIVVRFPMEERVLILYMCQSHLYEMLVVDRPWANYIKCQCMYFVCSAACSHKYVIKFTYYSNML